MKKFSLLCTTLALLLAFTPPVLAQEEVQDGSVLREGDIILNCEVFFEALERFRNNPPSDLRSQRDYEEALGYVRLCTEREI